MVKTSIPLVYDGVRESWKKSKWSRFKSYFLRKTDRFWAGILYVQKFFIAKSLQKTYLYVHEKLQRNPFVGSGLKFFIFWPYGFDYLWFLTNARRGAMRSKTQWVFYRDLDWWLGPQNLGKSLLRVRNCTNRSSNVHLDLLFLNEL